MDSEPWLRGNLEEVPQHVRPLFFSFQQVREDLARFTAHLTERQLWLEVEGSSVGFHLKHIAGSVDRLTTYLFEGELSSEQLIALQEEHAGTILLQALLQQVHDSLRRAEARLMTLDLDQLFAPRFVGRNKLPSSVFGLIIHTAEHTQRHLGQAITLAKAVQHQT